MLITIDHYGNRYYRAEIDKAMLCFLFGEEVVADRIVSMGGYRG